ncbi:MAG TPA: VWA domain-containing protein [Pyrinomonadaceae bacterium]
MGNRLASYISYVTTLALVLAACATTFPQQKERPKLKNFGSSLKRTKWDPKKQQAVVAKPNLKSKDDDLDVVKVETNLVTSDVLVLDALEKPVDGLTENDFLISEDGVQQKLGMFSRGANTSVARTIVLIIDYSGSQLPYIETSIDAAKVMIDKLGPLDRMAIVSDDVELIQDFTTDKKKLKDKLESLRKRTWSSGPGKFGMSKQYSALFATLNEVFNNEDERPIVIFQTDGDELWALQDSPMRAFEPPDPKTREYSRQFLPTHVTSFSLADIYRAAERSRVTIYTVVPGSPIIGLSHDEQLEQVRAYFELNLRTFRNPYSEGLRKQVDKPAMLEYQRQTSVLWQTALASVATVSGGWLMFLERPDQADEIYSRIFADINRRYLVGYYPTNKEHDGKRRRIAVTIRDHPDYKVMGRVWYYAPGADQ